MTRPCNAANAGKIFLPPADNLYALELIIVAAKAAGGDSQNPDAKLRSRPRLGLVFMQGFKYDDDNKWDDGKIYDPESGKTYSCYMKMESANTMEVKGYIGFSLIGKSQSWTRVK